MKDQMEMLVGRKDVYKNRAADLEARVCNDHELLIDLRESEYKLEMERRMMHERHRQLKADIDALRAKPAQSQVSRMEKELREQLQRANLLAAQLETAEMRTPVPNVVAELSGTIDDLKERLTERDEQVYELQHVNKALRLDLEELETQQARYAAQHDEALAQEARKRRAMKDKASRIEAENKEFREVMESQGRDMLTVQEEYERLRKLLHSEMRSQAKEAISRNLIPGTPSSADGYLELVAAEARRRVKAIIAKENEQSPDEPYADPHVRIEQLERELRYHVNELIRSKRDNRSFRKDIKRANTKLDKIRNSKLPADASPSSHQQLITPAQSPDRERPSTTGLGISTTTPSPSASSQPNSESPLRPRTPGRTTSHKQLPRYPNLPEQPPLTNLPPPTRDPPALPPPPSREPPPPPPQEQQQEQTPRTPIYKLTPSIARTPSNASTQLPPRSSIASTQAMPRSPAKRPPHQRYYTTTCIVSSACTTSPSSRRPTTTRSSSSRPAPPPNPTQPSLPKRAATLTTRRPNPHLVAHNPTAPIPVPDTPWPRPSTAGATAAGAPRPVVIDASTAALTALPQRPSTGSWKAEARSQEERLGLVGVRKQRSVEGLQGLLMRRKKSVGGAASLRRAVTSGGRQSRAMVGGEGQVVVPVVMEGR